MKIEHLAIWVDDLENMKRFYMKFLNMLCSQKYINEKKGFSSYFLSFESGARIELMHRYDITEKHEKRGLIKGLAHFAISLGSKEKVDNLTKEIEKSGHTIIGLPRTTGDGFYESVIADPEGNHIELTE